MQKRIEQRVKTSNENQTVKKRGRKQTQHTQVRTSEECIERVEWPTPKKCMSYCSIDDNLMILVECSNYSLSEKMMEKYETMFVEELLDKRMLNERKKKVPISFSRSILEKRQWLLCDCWVRTGLNCCWSPRRRFWLKNNGFEL